MLAIDEAGEPLSDAALKALIGQLNKGLMDIASNQVAVIAAEGRRMEFTSSNRTMLHANLRDLMAEARRRGLEIGGCRSSAITVEIG